MKRFLCLALVLALLMITLPVRAEKLTALWTANPKISAPIYSEPSTQSKTLGRIYQGASVKVYSFDPEWAYINSSGVVGYVLRRHLESGKAIDSSTTPPFGVEMYGYVGTVGANGAKVRTEADESADVLIPLTAGTRISIIGVVNGWAYLAYYRQYGYVNTNELSELLPVCPEDDAGTDEAPIATFTTYYVTGSNDVSKHGKEVNIGVNCDYINNEILQSGKTINYNNHYGPFYPSKGYVKGPVLIETGWGLGPGGGVCQVSSTMYNLLLQLPGITICAAPMALAALSICLPIWTRLLATKRKASISFSATIMISPSALKRRRRMARCSWLFTRLRNDAHRIAFARHSKKHSHICVAQGDAACRPIRRVSAAVNVDFAAQGGSPGRPFLCRLSRFKQGQKVGR